MKVSLETRRHRCPVLVYLASSVSLLGRSTHTSEIHTKEKQRRINTVPGSAFGEEKVKKDKFEIDPGLGTRSVSKMEMAAARPITSATNVGSTKTVVAVGVVAGRYG